MAGEMSEERRDWQEVVDAKPSGYAEFHDEKLGLVFRGPIKSVTIDEWDFVIIRLWSVKQMGLPGRPGHGRWVRGPDERKVASFSNLAVPFVFQPDNKGRRIVFRGYRSVNFIFLDEVP